MEKSVAMSVRNRTGIGMSPLDSQDIIDMARQAAPSSGGDEMARTESRYIREAEPLGTVPVPGTLTGAAQSIAGKLAGRNPEVFIDKLGERLAFERTGARLYDYLITKCEALAADAGISVETLRRFREEEAMHFRLVSEALESLGADPTAETPAADAVAVAASGVLKVLSDPRTSVPQCLDAMLTAELADNAGWELLFRMAGAMELHDMEADFRAALIDEEDHLAQIREWHDEGALREAGLTPVA